MIVEDVQGRGPVETTSAETSESVFFRSRLDGEPQRRFILSKQNYAIRVTELAAAAFVRARHAGSGLLEWMEKGRLERFEG